MLNHLYLHKSPSISTLCFISFIYTYLTENNIEWTTFSQLTLKMMKTAFQTKVLKVKVVYRCRFKISFGLNKIKKDPWDKTSKLNHFYIFFHLKRRCKSTKINWRHQRSSRNWDEFKHFHTFLFPFEEKKSTRSKFWTRLVRTVWIEFFLCREVA